MEGPKYWQECRVLFDMTNISERTWNLPLSENKNGIPKPFEKHTPNLRPPKKPMVKQEHKFHQRHMSAQVSTLHSTCSFCWRGHASQEIMTQYLRPKKCPRIIIWIDGQIFAYLAFAWKAMSFLRGFFEFNKAPLQFNVFHSYAEILFWRLRKCFGRTSTSCREVKHIIRSLWEKSHI